MVLEISVFHDSSKEVLLCKICNVHQVLQNVQVNITPLASRGALVFSILDSSPASHADCNMEQAEGIGCIGAVTRIGVRFGWVSVMEASCSQASSLACPPV